MPKQSTLERGAAFRRALLAWYRTAARDLPWRRTRDPYRVLVSEFMLQQTQVSRVLDYYDPFLRRYPTVGALARARRSAVREAWEGLGYYRRAANLHRLAKEVVRRHDGVVPRESALLLRLPGVGPYTAGAVATFAYEQPVAAVDTNVARVLRRVFSCQTAKTARTMAQQLQPKRGATAWRFNQALMELGALVCTARAPRCPTCPVNGLCNWYRKTGNH
ncbi:MAG: A/G-specific adenine glycosylase [Gemmatimonadales bacterium]